MALSDDHKAAMADGRRESRAINTYLKALDTPRRRGPRPTPERLAALREQAENETNPLKKVELIQRAMDAEQKLAETPADMAELEKGFAKYAKAFSERKGITYAAWRELGVPAKALKAAGISRGA